MKKIIIMIVVFLITACNQNTNSPSKGIQWAGENEVANNYIGKGIFHWYHVEWVHNHRNNAKIGIYNKEGKLVVKGGFMMICNNDSFTLIEDLEQQIVYFDGKKIQIKNSSCYLMK